MCALGSSFHLHRNVNRIHCLHTIRSQLHVSWLLTGLPKEPAPRPVVGVGLAVLQLGEEPPPALTLWWGGWDCSPGRGCSVEKELQLWPIVFIVFVVHFLEVWVPCTWNQFWCL